MFNYIFSILLFMVLFEKNKLNDDNIHQNCLERIAFDLKHPTIVIPWIEKYKFLVSEHAGIIRLLTIPGDCTHATSSEIFLDITDRVLTSDKAAEERGLLSFALDPHFIENGYLYVCYSTKTIEREMDHKTVVSRFKSVDNNLGKIDKRSEKMIMEIEQPGRRQNGGQIFFGTDNYLYITTGDGGDLENKRFKMQSLLGKILRIDVRSNDCERTYCIPTDNPYVNRREIRSEIFAYGFRNPWRCSVDQGHPETGEGRGRIICGDNGEEHPNEEEISLLVAGGRYGWLELNESYCHTLAECKDLFHKNGRLNEDQLPLHVYSHPKGQAVVGGVVYRGKSIPYLYGKYIYADFVHGTFHYLEETTDGWIPGDLPVDLCGDSGTLEQFYIIGVAVDHNDEIIVMMTQNLSNSSPTGALYRLVVSSERLVCSSTKDSARYNSPHYLFSVVFSLIFYLTDCISNF